MMRAELSVSEDGVAERHTALSTHNHKTVNFRMSAELEMKFQKRAKAQSQTAWKAKAETAKNSRPIRARSYLGGRGSILSRMPIVSSMVLHPISRLLGLSLSTVSCVVCQNTSL